MKRREEKRAFILIFLWFFLEIRHTPEEEGNTNLLWRFLSHNGFP